MEDKKPTFVPSLSRGYGSPRWSSDEAGEAKEDNMSVQDEREAVGLSPEEVREINKLKTERQKDRKTEKLANVLAASLTAARTHI